MRITESQLREAIRSVLAEQEMQVAPSTPLAQPASPLPVSSVPKRGKVMDVASALEKWLRSNGITLPYKYTGFTRPATRWSKAWGPTGGYVEPSVHVPVFDAFDDAWDLMQKAMGPTKEYNRQVWFPSTPDMVEYIPWGNFIFTPLFEGGTKSIGISTKGVQGLKK